MIERVFSGPSSVGWLERRAGSRKFVEKKSKIKKKPTVEVNRSFCKGCGICVAFCPKEVLELDDHEKAVVKRPEQCNACMLCELRCPDIAIEVRTEEREEVPKMPKVR